jgi:hypothetical protein
MMVPIHAMAAEVSRTRPTTFAMAVTVLFFISGCEVRDSTSQMNRCLSPVLLSLKRAPTSKNVECDVGETIALLALPRGPIKAEELKQLGVPDEVALAVSAGTEGTTDRWCAIAKVRSDDDSQLPKAGQRYVTKYTQQCASSEVRINRPFFIEGKRFVVTLNVVSGELNVTDVVAR